MIEARPEGPDFWRIADELIAAGDAEEGTIMGHPCLRVNGAFLAMAEHEGDALIVKLPAYRVDTLIACGVGRAFAPAGKRFREWVAISASQGDRWRALIEEARDFIRASKA